MTSLRDAARGALYGLAIGDALGMPTQSLPRATIVDRYGPLVPGFVDGPDDQPLAPGLPAGTVTDDTEQALLLARLLVEHAGSVPDEVWAHRLIAWEQSMRDRGSLDLLGPSTRRALEQLQRGVDPDETGRTGTTNGAAMRIAPVGIATPSADPDVLVQHVLAASRITHNTGVALAGAAAVATVISAALDGADLHVATHAAIDAAGRAERFGHWIAAAGVPDRIDWATRLVAGRDLADAARLIDRLVGTSLAAQESVPAAFAVLHAAADDPWTVARLGASVGGDCDTIAAMAAAMAGALHGASGFPASAVDQVETANQLGVSEIVDGLLDLRSTT